MDPSGKRWYTFVRIKRKLALVSHFNANAPHKMILKYSACGYEEGRCSANPFGC